MKKLKLFFIVLLAASTLLSAQNKKGQMVNRYGMKLAEQNGKMILKDRDSYEKIIDLNQIPDLLVPYTYVPDKVKESDFASCTSKKYVYKKYPDYELALEVDLPKGQGKGPFPYMIYIHGGSWYGGSYPAHQLQSQYMASRGIAGIRITYSLIPQGGTYEKSIADIYDAVRFIQDHAVEWNLDNSRFGFFGGSAGGHLAGIAAMTVPGTKVFVGLNGVYDLWNKTIIRDDMASEARTSVNDKYFDTGNPATAEANAKKASALYLIPDGKLPATLLFHGTGDITVYHDQSVRFAEALRAKGGTVQLQIDPYYVHGYFKEYMTDKYEDCMLMMCDFLKKNL